MFSILDPVRMREALDSVETLTDCEMFQSLASELISTNIQIRSSNEADKAACDFTVSIASAYRISTRKQHLFDRKYEIPGLVHLLKHKRNFRKLWHETRDAACKTTVNWVARNIRRMVRKRALERWGKKLANCEVTPQAIWPFAKSLTKKGVNRKHHLQFMVP
jgi:hypothetical protein